MAPAGAWSFSTGKRVRLDITVTFVNPIRIETRGDDRLDTILTLIRSLTQQGGHMSQELDALAAQVASNTDAEQSALLLLNQLHDLLVAAGTDPVKLADLTTQLASSKDLLAAAIVANTPGAPVPDPGSGSAGASAGGAGTGV